MEKMASLSTRMKQRSVLSYTSIIGDIGDIVFIVFIGDNLGHYRWLSENFSSISGYICRFCETTKPQFSNKLHYIIAAPVNTQSYDFAVQQLKANTEDHIKGIKFNSSFNLLQFFHVCNPGLPSCLSHDLFEGIVADDLAIYIRYFVEIKKSFLIFIAQ